MLLQNRLRTLPSGIQRSARLSNPARGPSKRAANFSTSSRASFKGKVFVIGDNVEGQLGVPGANCARPTPIEGLPEIVNFACGDLHTLLVDVNGEVWSFGASSFGETGLGVDIDIAPPLKVDLKDKIVSAAAGKAHSLLLSERGEVYSFGDGESAQLGYAASGSNGEPKKIDALKGVNIKKIICGAQHNLAIDDKNGIYSWGAGHCAQHGHSKVDMVIEPKKIATLANDSIRLAAAGVHHSVVVTDDDRVMFFGAFRTKTPGSNLHRTHFFMNPTPIKDLELKSGEHWTHLTSGMTHNVISSNLGRTFAWGLNTGSAVGANTTQFDHAVPLASLDGVVFELLQSGTYHNIGFDTHGACWVWGQGSDFQLSTDRRSHDSPLRIDLGLPPNTRVKKISAGWAHTIFLVDAL